MTYLVYGNKIISSGGKLVIESPLPAVFDIGLGVFSGTGLPPVSIAEIDDDYVYFINGADPNTAGGEITHWKNDSPSDPSDVSIFFRVSQATGDLDTSYEHVHEVSINDNLFNRYILIDSSENRTLVFGGFNTWTVDGQTSTAKNLVALDSQGKIDPTFNSGLGMVFDDASLAPDSSINVVATKRADGKYLVALKTRAFEQSPFFYDGTYIPSGVFVLNTDGTLDTSFNWVSSYAVNLAQNIISDLKVFDDDSFILVDDGGNPVKFKKDGTVDTSYTCMYYKYGSPVGPPVALGIYSQINSYDVTSDGFIVYTGAFCSGTPPNELSATYGMFVTDSSGGFDGTTLQLYGPDLESGDEDPIVNGTYNSSVKVTTDGSIWVSKYRDITDLHPDVPLINFDIGIYRRYSISTHSEYPNVKTPTILDTTPGSDNPYPDLISNIFFFSGTKFEQNGDDIFMLGSTIGKTIDGSTGTDEGFSGVLKLDLDGNIKTIGR